MPNSRAEPAKRQVAAQLRHPSVFACQEAARRSAPAPEGLAGIVMAGPELSYSREKSYKYV